MKFSNNFFHFFTTIKAENLVREFVTKLHFDWEFLRISTVTLCQGPNKKVPSLQVAWPTPAPPILSVTRVVLLHKETFLERP